MHPVALILVEGETEEEFYSLLIEQNCPHRRKKIKNLHGNFNINTKIVDEAVKFANAYPEKEFEVFICIDQERIGFPAYNHNLCESNLRNRPNFKRIIPVVAILMCESLFFLDIDGIYKFLRAPVHRRKPKNFKNFRKLTHLDLAHLFKMFGKQYRKGKKCANFVAHLDLNKILQAEEIRRLIDTLRE